MNEWPTAAMFELMNEWRVAKKVWINEREGAGRVWPYCTIQSQTDQILQYTVVANKQKSCLMSERDR